MAICQPIRAPKWRTPLIAKAVALTAWTISALLMVPVFMYANTLEVTESMVSMGEVFSNYIWTSFSACSLCNMYLFFK